MKLPGSQKGFSPIIVLVLVVIVAVVGGGYVLLSKIDQFSSQSLLRQIKKGPYEELEEALNKTSSATTAYADYKTKVNSRVTFTKTGVTQNLENNADGYITGSIDGKTSKVEIRIYNSSNPSASVNINVISTEDGYVYLKGPATGTKWQKFTKSEFEAQAEKTPTDASLYGFEILSTLFSEDKALFKATKRETVQKLPDQTQGDKTLAKYEVEVSVVDFVNALRQDKERSEKDINDAQVILKDAVIKTTYSVDKNSGYVTKLVAEAKNLTQIPTPESEQLGISTQHDLILTVDLSRFNVPTGITPPNDSELVNPGSKT